MKTAALFFGVSVAVCAVAETWFVDSERGDDAASGTSEATAVRTLDQVNRLDVKPGDRVLFRRGGLWRGTLRPRSGEPGRPVTYATYGTGAKPILQQSVDRSRPEDWVQEGADIWATRPRTPPVVKERIRDAAALLAGWSGSFQEGNRGAVRTVAEGGERFVRVTDRKSVV